MTLAYRQSILFTIYLLAMKIRSSTPHLFLFLLFFHFLPIVAAQSEVAQALADSTKPSIFEFFNSGNAQGELLKVELRANFKKLIKRKYRNEYLPATISYSIDNQSFIDSVGVRPRGKSRRKICHLPPIKIKYSKATLKSKGLRKFKTLKLVNHCRTSSQNQEIILREYLIYKLYEVLTDVSFRVQLIEVDYVDTGRRNKKTSRYAFIIENNDEMASRLGGTMYDPTNVNPEALELIAYHQLCLFQYMVGNTDWHLKQQHNIKIVRPDSGKYMLAIPYDFDYCGMVNAYYAVPNKNINIDNVRTRLYMGKCFPMEVYAPLIQKFKDNKSSFYNLIDQFELLNGNQRADMRAYLDEYFDELDNKKRLVEKLRWKCGS